MFVRRPHSNLNVCLCVHNSKILTLKELPSSDQKIVGERLSQKNGDVRRSTEKLPNGPEAAPSKSTNTHNAILFGFVTHHRSYMSTGCDHFNQRAILSPHIVLFL